jgi:hypothetical protein
MLRATTIGVAVMTVAWVAISILLPYAIAFAAGWDAADRLVPYANAHLLEEASLGVYQPWRDPVFWLGVVGNSAVPIAIATFVCAKLDAKAPFLVTAIGVLTLVFIHRHVFTSGFPAAIRAGSVIEICVAGLTGVLTLTALGKIRPSSSGAV